MDATTMPSIDSLISKLTLAYPEVTFTISDTFGWAPRTHTVFYEPRDPEASAQVLHEVSHAILTHTDYSRDVALLGMERDAWHHAISLASSYDVVIADTVVQAHLDTYRQWLHARSRCPHCEATGVQSDREHYHCVACGADWKVNEARSCELRRYTKTPA